MRRIAALLVAFCVRACLFAQISEADLRARLINTPLYLRGQWGCDQLTFNDTGHLIGACRQVPFTVSGIDIDQVKLTSRELVLTGRSAGLEFQDDSPMRVTLFAPGPPSRRREPEKITIYIRRPASGDFKPALDQIFAPTLADMVPLLPSFWQCFAQKNLASSDSANPAGTCAARTVAKVNRNDPDLTPPKVLRSTPPEFSDAARIQHYNGKVVVNLLVDKQGKPEDIRILHPAGLGLDEQAVAAVQQYVFQPAMRAGEPIVVQVNMEVAFSIMR
jgi:TonB family protein